MPVKERGSTEKPRIGAGAVTSSPAGLLDRLLHTPFHIGWAFAVLGSLLLLNVYILYRLTS